MTLDVSERYPVDACARIRESLDLGSFTELPATCTVINNNKKLIFAGSALVSLECSETHKRGRLTCPY